MKILLTENQFKILTEKLIIEATDQWKMNPMDYYGLLGVDKTANKDTIKKAYRKLALKYHPDSNPDNKEAEEIFKNAAEAYNTLSNDSIKNKYDEWHEKVWPLIKQQKETQAQNQNKEKERQERERQEQERVAREKQEKERQEKERQEQERVAREKQEKEKNRGKSLPVPSSNSNSNSNKTNTSNNNTNNNNNNNNNNNSGGTGRWSTTSNTSNTGPTISQVLDSDETLRNAYYQAPNIFGILFNLLSGRKAFEGKGYIKIIDLVNDLKYNLEKIRDLLPNIHNYFVNNKQPIEFNILGSSNISFPDGTKLTPNTDYKLKLNMNKLFDNYGYLNCSFIDSGNTGKRINIKIIAEVDDGVNDELSVMANITYTDINDNKRKTRNSTPERFKIKLISNANTGYHRK